MFSCEFCKSFKNTFSNRTPLVAASETVGKSLMLILDRQMKTSCLRIPKLNMTQWNYECRWEHTGFLSFISFSISLREDVVYTLFCRAFPFHLPWKHRKTFDFVCFQGVSKRKMGKKWVKRLFISIASMVSLVTNVWTACMIFDCNLVQI